MSVTVLIAISVALGALVYFCFSWQANIDNDSSIERSETIYYQTWNIIFRKYHIYFVGTIKLSHNLIDNQSLQHY